MLAFMIAALVGVAQVLLTERLIKAFNTRNSKRILLFFAAKFVLYGIGVGLVVLKFVWQLSLVLCGFAAAVPITAIVLFVYRTIYKKTN